MTEGSEWLAGAGPYLALLNNAEQHYGIPHNLLVRIAFQECSWRPEVINGTVKSPAGAVGMMQLMPADFPNAGVSIAADISAAAHYLANLYARFHDWQLAVAAYNDGPGNVHAYTKGWRTLPPETLNYVAQVCADVPLSGALLNA